MERLSLVVLILCVLELYLVAAVTVMAHQALSLGPGFPESLPGSAYVCVGRSLVLGDARAGLRV